MISYVESHYDMKGCPNCGGNALYGCYYADLDLHHIVCDKCGANIFELKDEEKVEQNREEIEKRQHFDFLSKF